MTTYDYPAEAKKRFDTLLTKHLQEGQRNFWRVALSFNTIIDYLDYLQKQKVKDPNFDKYAEDVAKAVVHQFKMYYQGGGGLWLWFDDLGWWAVSTAIALSKPYYKGN